MQFPTVTITAPKKTKKKQKKTSWTATEGVLCPPR